MEFSSHRLQDKKNLIIASVLSGGLSQTVRQSTDKSLIRKMKHTVDLLPEHFVPVPPHK